MNLPRDAIVRLFHPRRYIFWSVSIILASFAALFYGTG